MPLIALLILVVPIVELILIVEVATRIGVFETLFLLIAISVAGGWLLKREGTAAWNRLRSALERGDLPTKEVIDGVMIVFGGALLLTPGFLTDVIGLALLLPPTRALLRRSSRRLASLIVLRRFGGAGATVSAGRRIYDARVTRDRRVDTRAMEQTSGPVTPAGSSPSETTVRRDEDDSPDRG